jgi:pathogenesis-related protein 1
MACYFFKVVVFALLCVLPFAVQGGENIVFSPTLQVKTVNTHNQNRGNVDPPAIKDTMKNVVWDNETAQYAQDWATCDNYNIHRATRGKNYKGMGENLFVKSGSSDPNDAIQGAILAWWNERNNYNYEADECTQDRVCGHYTQVVWGSSAKIGCAYATNCGSNNDAIFIVCNYNTAGNCPGLRPYSALINDKAEPGGTSEDCEPLPVAVCNEEEEERAPQVKHAWRTGGIGGTVNFLIEKGCCKGSECKNYEFKFGPRCDSLTESVSNAYGRDQHKDWPENHICVKLTAEELEMDGMSAQLIKYGTSQTFLDVTDHMPEGAKLSEDGTDNSMTLEEQLAAARLEAAESSPTESSPIIRTRTPTETVTASTSIRTRRTRSTRSRS